MGRGDGTEDVAGRVSPGVSSEIQQKYGMGCKGAASGFNGITRLYRDLAGMLRGRPGYRFPIPPLGSRAAVQLERDMSRARRLSEIAKANQPVFSSTNGTQWWLADPSSKTEPDPAPPSKIPDPEPAAVAHAAVAVQDAQLEGVPAQSPIPAPVVSHSSGLQEPSNEFAEPELEETAILLNSPEIEETAILLESQELEEPSLLFRSLALETPSILSPSPELLKPTNGSMPLELEPEPEPEPAPRDLATRLGSLKERFLSLGRKRRAGERE